MSALTYATLNKKRAAQISQLTRINDTIANFDPELQSIHVLRSTREKLAKIDVAHQTAIEALMEHEEANYDQIDEDLDRFRLAHCDALVLLETKIDSLCSVNGADEMNKLNHEIAAVKFHFSEFQTFVTDCDTECLNASELRMRYRDLQPIHSTYSMIWNQIHERGDDAQRIQLKEDRKRFTDDYYKVLAWFDTRITSRSSSQAGPSSQATNSSAHTVRLPKIELPKFDGSPDTWIVFRDSFRSIIHDVATLSGAVKFRYLKTSITDKHSPINHLLESDDGYEDAWTAVIEFYDDKRRIVDCHFNGMLSVKRMNAESHDELQRVLNEYSLNIASLERLYTEEELYRAFLAHIILQRLDTHTRDLWETENKGCIPFWPDLQRFLKERRKTLSSMPAVKSTPVAKPAMPVPTRNGSHSGSKSTWGTSAVHAVSKSSSAHSAHSSAPSAHSIRGLAHSATNRKCFMCNGEHRLSTCQQFLNTPIPQRLAKVREWNICSNCFGLHALAACASPYKCRSCQQRHHTMLHMEKNSPAAPLFPSSVASIQAPTHHLQASATPFLFSGSACNAASTSRRSVTLLQTAMVQIQDAFGEWRTARAFLDSGSDSNYISKSVAIALKLPMEPTYIEANGLGGTRSAVITQKISAIVGTMKENFSMEFLVTPKVTNPTPTTPIDPNLIGIPPNLPLADPSFCIPGKIDILIGNTHYGDLIRDGRIKLASGPVLLNSVFGWLFSGSVPQSAIMNAPPAHTDVPRSANAITTNCHHSTLVELRNSIEKFYKLEDYRNDKRFLTDEEAHCEKIFEQTHRRAPSGRFEVTLPFKEIIDQLINNYRSVLCQFLANEKRIQKNDALRQSYIDFMREYESLGHMTEIDISKEPPNAQAFYFPHHAVEKPDSTTTAVRIVFNGSARTSSGLSLNDAQCVGPQIQSDAFTLSLRFRQHSIVIKADIAKMYRQITVAPQQRIYQRIFWRESPQDRLKIFSLNTVTYGTASASFQSTRCLKQLAIENRETFPKAAEEILNSFYVDDYLSGADDIHDAIKLAKEVSGIIGSAEMKLRKFNSNNKQFLESLPEEDRETPKANTAIKALGIKWDPSADTIGFDIKPIEFVKITRRIILSEIAKIYDPEGLLGPVTFRFKLFLKAIFKLAIPWDTQLSAQEAGEWTEIASTFPELAQIRIPRHVVIDQFIDIQLHGFSDASNLGYGACVYVRSKNHRGQIMCNLLCAKSRIAPTEYRSTARLELCGAVVLAQLMQQVKKALTVPISKRICWSDSAIALQWLKKEPSQLQPFVANRVSVVQELSVDIIWRHAPGPQNPADDISRGLTPSEIIKRTMWWHGPEFLRRTEPHWPSSIVVVDPKEPSYANEFKKIESLVFATSTSPNSVLSPEKDNLFIEWTEASSRTWAVKRKLAPIMRFVHNTQSVKLNKQRRIGPMQVADLMDAEHAIARMYQAKHFREDFNCCVNGKSIPRSSNLKSLDPYYDASIKLLRVGGRLTHAECDDSQKHPIILPNCHFTKLIIRETHQRNLHAGQNATHSLVRMRYWPMRAKHIIRQEVHKCIKCFRARPRLTQQFMGHLPAKRITSAPMFYHTGVDYCGPFNIKLSTTRNAKAGKAYVALFVCLATKAIHMEIVSELSTVAFFTAFDKFTSRRGLPKTIHSDNGLNFVGANNELREFYEFLAQNTTQKEIHRYLAEQEIEWNFIPPRAPEHGGLWEAGVKSMKHHFYRVAENALLTFEEFDRLKCKIEAILNSRPLTSISDDPSDFSALTAGHFLIGRPLVAKPDRDLTQVSVNRLQRWERVVAAQQHFWNRWNRDYLHQLQVRTKNYKDVVPVAVGQLVLLHVDHSPPMHWPLGRIIDIYPGKDGITRVASVRTSKSTYERPVTKLAILPIDPVDDQLEPAEDVND